MDLRLIDNRPVVVRPIMPRERGVLRRTATMLADNVPAHRLLQRMSARLTVEPQGTAHKALLELAA